MKHDSEPQPGETELEAAIEIAAEDAIGASAEPPVGAASAPEITPEGEDERESGNEHSPSIDSEPLHSDSGAEPQPTPKLERLQKILAQAGVASRRHAEELITQGRVQVNGKVVTVMGSKADPARDHIRVDGKLIHSTERLRYFMLNKPKGFVTTVSDPEGRPTVMQFFQKMNERLYPVGRLDYQSEGLLLVTNDGELANRLTRAATGVEKTYLVKVSGRPTEAELDILRQGVAIERGKPGSSPVHTAPARIRQVRHGDNPWYEVVLIEGRNRELRKMFQEIGHFVEKIRRVGYGPLVLDVEPGKLRELDPEELTALRRAAEGKPSRLKSREPRRRDERAASKPAGRVAGRPGYSRPPTGFPARTAPTARSEQREAGPGRDRRDPRGRDKREVGRDRQGTSGAPGEHRGPSGPGGERRFGAKPSWKKPGTGKWPPRPQPSAPGMQADRFNRPGAVRSSSSRSSPRQSAPGRWEPQSAPGGEFRGRADRPFRVPGSRGTGNPKTGARPAPDARNSRSFDQRGRPSPGRSAPGFRARPGATPQEGFKRKPGSGKGTGPSHGSKPPGDKRSGRK